MAIINIKVSFRNHLHIAQTCNLYSQNLVAHQLNEYEVVNPRGDHEKSSVAYCSYKNHNFANIGHKNTNDA